MKVEEGLFVRHTSKPEWGVGKIEGINGENVFVRFTGQLKTLKMAFAERLLEPAGADEFGARTSTRGGPAVGRITACGVCGKSLDKSRRSLDGEWKACVRCSANDGTEHVFYRYPDAFASGHGGDDDSGTQGDCSWCRSGRIAPAGEARHCTDMMPARG
jgi:hypothetical protein